MAEDYHNNDNNNYTEWTRSAIAEELYLQMCKHDQNEGVDDKSKYFILAIKYANRRAIVKQLRDFTDVFTLHMQTFSPTLQKQLWKLCASDPVDALNEVITSSVRKIIKSNTARIYYEYLQNEPLRWSLLDGDGNGKGDGSVITEHIINLADEARQQNEEESLKLILAKRIMQDHIFKTTNDNGQLFCYNGKTYVPDQEWIIKQQCRLIEPEVTNHIINEVISYIKDSTYIDRSEFDKDPDLLCLQNGVLNIRTKELIPHSPDYLSLTQLPIEYNVEAKCPRIEEFLNDVLESDKHVKYMYWDIGYCLLSDCRYQTSVMLYGNSGANGKGTLLELITIFLDEKNCSHRSLQQIDTNRFAIADLFGKMANIYADLKSTKLSETGNYKMLAAGDFITGEFKNKNAFKFKNRAKLWFSANEIPESDDKSDAYYRRWRIYHFNKRFVDGSENPNLLSELTTPEELSELLNLALKGLEDLIKEGGFHDRTIEEVRRDYEIHTNDVNAFLSEECIVDITNPGYSTLATDVYAAYVNFCVKRKTRPIDMNPFGKRLADKGIYNQRHKAGGQSEHYYDGITLINNIRGENSTLPCK